MIVTVRQRKQGDRMVWQADFAAIPKGEDRPDRFRLTAPRSVTSESGAIRWANEQARKIQLDGRPRNNRKGKQLLAQAAAEVEAARVPTLAEVWPRFLECMVAERRAPNTMKVYGVAWRSWIEQLLGPLPVDRIGVLEVARLKASMREAAPSTTNNALGTLAGMLKVSRLICPAASAPEIKRVKPLEDEHRRVYTPEQAAALVKAAAARPEWLVAILLALDAGLRSREVSALRWCDLDLARRELTVRHSMIDGQLGPTKNRKTRRVPLTARLLAAIRAVPDQGSHLPPEKVLLQAVFEASKPADRWVVPRSRTGNFDLQGTVRAVTRLAGLPDLGPHALRHSFASFLLAGGGRLPAVSKMLGHADVKVTAEAYAHVMPGAERDAIDHLETVTRAAPVTDLAQERKRRILES